jgi:6-phosphogluconolactonase
MLTRRSLLKALPGIVLLPRSVGALAARPQYKLFIGTGTNHPSNSKGIYIADWNPGALGEISLAADMKSPTFIATDSRFRGLYAVSEAANGEAVAFDIKKNDATLALTRLNEQSTRGSGPAHIAVSPNGRAVFAANYGSGSLTAYTILRTGELSSPVSHFQYEPVDDRPEHQQPHAHEATPTHDGNWLLVNDLGSDRIYIYRVNRESGRLTPGAQAFWQGRFKSGPRHLAFHPNGRWVYNANELDATVDHLLWNSEEGTLITQHSCVSTLPPAYTTGQSTASEILVSPDGKSLYVGNRGHETITRFVIQPRTGELELAQLAPHGGRTARHIALDPTARFLLVACQDSGTIVVMGRDPVNGQLSEPLRSYPIDSPQCLVFVS